MLKVKRTIKKTVFLSHISIIIFSTLITILIFNISLNMYIKAETKSQLITAAESIRKSTTMDLFNLSKKQQIDSSSKDVERILGKIDRTLKQTQYILNTNYAVLDNNFNVLLPLYSDNEESNTFNESILPLVNKDKALYTTSDDVIVNNFNINNHQFVSLLHPLKLENSDIQGYLLLYSDVTNRNNLIFKVNGILVSILLITSIVAFIISNALSKKISHPITRLSEYAERIGNRDYEMESLTFEEYEINQLSGAMKTMADNLMAYDNTIKTFLQNSSHELRTPLMSIQGYAEGIKYGVVNNKEAAVDIIIEETKRITSIVEDLLYLSKIDSMQSCLRYENIVVEDLIRTCIERVNGIAVNKNIDIVFLNPSSEVSLLGDEDKLCRSIINILSNCLRYANKTITIEISKDNTNVTIVIMDDGCGFDEKDLKNIFQRFYKGKGGNYGLGLAITYSIILKHGGSIAAKNNSTGGAFFQIQLPMKL